MRQYNLDGALKDLSVEGSLPNLRADDKSTCGNATFTPNTDLPLGIFQKFKWGKVFYFTVESYKPLEGWSTFGEENNE